MKCEELIAYNVVATADVNPEVVDSLGCTEWTGYDKNEVDAAITELKARIHELESIPHTDNSAVIERLSNENERLKAKLESVQATAYAESVDASMENRRLKRALWLARAARAQTVALLWNAYYYENNYDNCLYYSDYMTVACNPFRNCSKKTALEWSDLWDSVEAKCRAKAEAYK